MVSAIERQMDGEIFEEDDQLDLCLLCCRKVDQKIVHKNDQNDKDLLYKNLTVIFLLKKVLQVPDAQLYRNLKECGNPDDWLSLCDQCNELSGRAKKLHSQIVKTARQLRNTEQLILDKIKSSLSTSPLKSTSSHRPVSPNRRNEQSRRKIWMRTRKFISSYSYSDQSNFINPFIEGDKLAQNYLNRQQNLSSTSPPKFEKEPGDIDDDYDTIWEEAEEEPGGKLDQKWKQELEDYPSTNSSNQLGRSSRNSKTNELSDTKSRELEDEDNSISKEALEKSIDLEEKLEPETPSIPISQRSLRLSRRRKSRKGSTGKSKVPPAKPRVQRNQTAHVKIYGKIKCNYCDKLYSTGSACYNHEREKHADAPGQLCCDLCPRLFNTEVYLDHHKRQAHKIRLDGSPYIWKSKKVKEKATPTICNICGKSVKYLEQHQKIVHEKSVKVFCHVCGRGFKVGTNFKHHLLTIHKDDPVTVKMRQDGVSLWRCQVSGCNSKFMHKVSLEKHVENVHRNYLEGEKNEELKSFVCQVCGKGFWKRDKLTRHEIIHTKKIL